MNRGMRTRCCKTSLRQNYILKFKSNIFLKALIKGNFVTLFLDLLWDTFCQKSGIQLRKHSTTILYLSRPVTIFLEYIAFNN